MSNSARILSVLDSLLTQEASLIIYGRAAIALGFENPPPATLRSLDVDALLSTSYETAFADTPEFWTAQEKLNLILMQKNLNLINKHKLKSIQLKQ